MQQVNQMVEGLYNEAKNKMVHMVQNDKNTYKQLLEKLILQSLIKMMEVNVQMRVRKSDMSLVQEVMPKAMAAYKKKMQTEVSAFNGKEVPLKLNIDEAHPLAEYSEEAGTESCIGGIILHARKGRIVCSNTLDERLQLCYQEAIPEIRGSLFPSIKKNRS